MLFFAPETFEIAATIGLDAFSVYFNGRAAPLGRVTPETAAAAFFNWEVGRMQQMLHLDEVDPKAVIDARERAATVSLTRLLADPESGLPDVSRAVELLREAVDACPPEGRILFAANQALPWPSEPLAALWHGANALREFRGDGHIAVLLTHGIGGVDALVLHAPYVGFSEKRSAFVEGTRGWSEGTYAGARARLAERGFLTGEGAITPAGEKFREMIEVETDQVAAAPIEALGPTKCEELLSILEPLAQRIVERKGAHHKMARDGASA